MDMWMKIGAAILIGAMIAMLLPQLKAMRQRSEEAPPADWPAVVLPLAAVVAFVLLLIALV